MSRGTVVYCVVPRELAPELHECLREHWRDHPTMVVVVERRNGERRTSETERSRGPERRGLGRPSGRRVTRQATPTSLDIARRLPRRARAHADRLLFVEGTPGGRRDAEDLEADRLVVRIQRGDAAAFDRLYMRYFDRVYAYARVALRDEHEAEDVAQQVFGNVIQALPRYRIREDSSFRAWLFRITRNVVLRTLSKNGRLALEEPAELDRRLESPVPKAPFSLEWLSDKDLAMLVERLPLSQRQVILLRYVFEFRTEDIASTLERSPVAIRMLEHRAMRGLEARLEVMWGNTSRTERASMVMRARQLPVLAARQLALHSPGGLAL